MTYEARTRIHWQGSADFDITLADLADAAGRQAALISSLPIGRPGALITLSLKPAAAPAANAIVRVYLIRGDGHETPIQDGGAGAADAAFTPNDNVRELGSLISDGTDDPMQATFDTWALGPLGPTWTIALKNELGQALASEGHVARYRYYMPESR